MTSDAVVSTTGQAVLGEGLRWDARRGELLAVDILAGAFSAVRSPIPVPSA